MASDKRFGIYTASFVHAGGTLSLTQLKRQSVNTNPTKKKVIPGGAIDPAAVLLSHADGRMSFSTSDLATLLGDVSLTTGLEITGAATMRFQERTQSGTFESGATHESFTASKGFLVVDSISASADDAEGAVVECSFVPLWDGTNALFVHNTGVDFSGVSAPAFASAFSLGPVYHNGSQIERVTRVTIRPGIEFNVKRTDGSPYASAGAIVRREPVFEFTCLKLDVSGSLNPFTRALSGTLACYFWKMSNNSDRVAVATTEHVKISCAAGNIEDDSVEVADEDDATITYRVHPTGTLSLSTASAIP